MKVALLNESFPPMIDGVSNCVFNYAENLSQHHCDCVVVTPRYPGVEDDYAFPVWRYSSFNFGKRLGYRVGNILDFGCLRRLRRGGFDILHIHSPFASSVLISLAQLGRRTAPVVVTYHTKFDFDIRKRVPTRPFQWIALRFLRHNLNRADEVWVVTEGAAESLREVGYQKPYRVMENGTDFPKGKAPDEAVQALKRRHGLEDAEFIFLFVGRMMWYKNTKLILDALKRLDEVNFKMVFVGDGADRADIETYANGIGLGDKTVFAGAVHDREEVRTYFSSADLFLFPSTYDTAGLVVKEAAACGLASLLVRGSCAAEGVEDRVSGFLCEENDEDMARVLSAAIADRQALSKVGAAATEQVYLSWEDAVAKAYSRYEALSAEWKQQRDAKRNRKHQK